MERIDYQGVELDRCTNCQGIWLDHLEKDDLSELKGSESVDIGDPGLGKRYNKQDKDIFCPNDGVKLSNMVDANQPHIWYECCPSCFGVFFDAGEFRDFKDHSLLDSFKGFFVRERKL
jgi:Zn-finger nucleic acid-binding protein